MKTIKKFKLACTLLVFTFVSVKMTTAQNTVAVPFSTGFVGNNTGNNTCGNAVYMSSLGWTNFQFAQQTSGTVFVAQGNDVPGFVQITDFTGVEHTIQGFIKWRTSSGGNSTSVVFAPASTSSSTLTTNSGTYTINSTKYIGMIFNGYSVTINGGNVSGNAAGSLDALNTYLVLLPDVTITDYTVNESAGTLNMTVTLSAATSSEVRVNYTSSNGTATSGADYQTISGSLTFAPNETSKTIVINILADNIAEPTENFYLTLSDPVNASILKTLSTISITDNPPLPVELVLFEVLCENEGPIVHWQTASEKNCAGYTIEMNDGYADWIQIGTVQGMGNTTALTEYQFAVADRQDGITYYRLKQLDFDGKVKTYDPVSSVCNPQKISFFVFADQTNGLVTIHYSLLKEKTGYIVMLDPTGREIKTMSIDSTQDSVILPAGELMPGLYTVVQIEEGVKRTERFVWR